MNYPKTALLLHQIAQIQHMEPGKLCLMRQGPKGPYYNLQWREDGKAISRYVPSDQVQAVTQNTANYGRFQTLMNQYAQIIIEQTRAEQATGVKKTSSPKSSSLKTRKSSN